jgi:S1-C subfamily serine protease
MACAEVDAEVLKAEADRVAVVKKISSCTIAVFSPGGAGGGSGVVISPDGFALTNFHVAAPSGNSMQCGMNDGKLYDAVIVGVDPTGDVALIKLFGRDDFPTAEMGDSDKCRAGDWAFAVGNPFLLATDFTPTVTYGIISGVNRYQKGTGDNVLEYTDAIQTDAAINPGNSGGPLFNADGQLIGINGRGSFEKRGRVNVGVGYAISINQIKHFLGYLHSGRIVDHATMGAIVSSDEDGRVVISDIISSSDAFRRGLQLDDEIVKFGGRTIRTPNGFKNVLGIYPKGWRVPLTYRRDGVDYNTYVRLAGNHSEGALVELVSGRPQQVPMPQPKPKDGDDEKKDGEKKDGEKQDDSEKKPKNKPIQFHKPVPMPKIVKDHFSEKKGYANYYYNEQHQKRVWQALVNSGDFSSVMPRWVITGLVTTVAGEGKYRIQIDPKAGEAELPDFHANVIFDDDLTDTLDPPATGGLLVAMHLWQRLLTRGLDDFGQIYYLGTAPLPGRDELLDVLVGIHGGVEAKFYFDPQTGRLAALEMFPDNYADPCELYFDDYQESGGRFLPRQMTVRNGDREYGVFHFAEIAFEKADDQ